MDAIRPTSRTVRAQATALLALVLWSGGCAHKQAPLPVDDARAEVQSLRAALVERERTIEQLRGKLALAEAGQRVLSTRLAERARDAALEPSLVAVQAVDEAPPAPPAGEREVESRRDEARRPLLRLHGEGGGEQRLRAPEQRLLTASWQPPATSERLTVAPVPSLSAKSVSSREQAEALYVQALDLVRRRRFASALREFDAFLRTFPDDVRTARAMFWRGEVLFAQREYAGALSAFEEVIAREPNGDTAPEVLLRMARCHLRLGALSRARSTIVELRDRFPGSDAARTALRLEQEET